MVEKSILELFCIRYAIPQSLCNNNRFAFCICIVHSGALRMCCGELKKTWEGPIRPIPSFIAVWTFSLKFQWNQVESLLWVEFDEFFLLVFCKLNSEWNRKKKVFVFNYTHPISRIIGYTQKTSQVESSAAYVTTSSVYHLWIYLLHNNIYTARHCSISDLHHLNSR